jgi:HPt (histidine-containing phosphotransfer) domain-containing protein
MIDAIVAAVDDEDMSTVSWNAHKLAGASGSIGFAELTHLLKNIEEKAKTGSSDPVTDLVQRIVTTHDKSIHVFSALAKT